jgi:hypothetical protein
VLCGLPSGGAGNSLATSDKFTFLALLFIRVIAPLAANRPVMRSVFCLLVVVRFSIIVFLFSYVIFIYIFLQK